MALKFKKKHSKTTLKTHNALVVQPRILRNFKSQRKPNKCLNTIQHSRYTKPTFIMG